MTRFSDPVSLADGEIWARLSRREFLNRTAMAGTAAGGLAMLAGFGSGEALATQESPAALRAESDPDHVQPQGDSPSYTYPQGLARPVDCPSSWWAMQNAF